MCRKSKFANQVSERSRKTARGVVIKKQKDERKAHKAYIENKSVRDTWVEDSSLEFSGSISVPTSEETATKTATEASEAAFDPSNLSFFTCGALVATNYHQGLAAAAATYKQPSSGNKNGSWCGQQWDLGHCELTNSAGAGFVAISRCLSIASQQLIEAQEQLEPDARPKITIFAHDADAINKISRVRYVDYTKERSDAEPVLVDIVKKSQDLSANFDAVIELVCIPRHVAAEGNRLACAAARKAATTQQLTTTFFD